MTQCSKSSLSFAQLVPIICIAHLPCVEGVTRPFFGAALAIVVGIARGLYDSGLASHLVNSSWLNCEVSEGMFTSEYAVAANQYDGRRFSLFASREDVRVQNQPNGSSVPGTLRVIPIKTKEDLVLVALPQPSLEAGSRVTVKTDQLHVDTTFIFSYRTP